MFIKGGTNYPFECAHVTLSSNSKAPVGELALVIVKVDDLLNGDAQCFCKKRGCCPIGAPAPGICECATNIYYADYCCAGDNLLPCRRCLPGRSLLQLSIPIPSCHADGQYRPTAGRNCRPQDWFQVTSWCRKTWPAILAARGTASPF